MWTHTLSHGFGRASIIGGGRVHVADARDRCFFGPLGGPASIVTLDLATGSGGGTFAPGGFGPTIVAGPKLVTITFAFGSHFAVYGAAVTDLQDGAENWTTRLGFGPFDPHPTSAAVGSERFVLAYGANVEAFALAPPPPGACDTTSFPPVCAPQWTRDVGAIATVPVLSPDEQTVFTTTAPGRVVALDASRGAVRWFADIGASGPVALDAGSLFVATTSGTVAAFPQSGCATSPCTPSWTGPTGARSTTTQPAVADGVVYTGADDGALRAFAAEGCGQATCAPLWSATTGSAIIGAPAVTQGHLVVGTGDGMIRAYAPTSGG